MLKNFNIQNKGWGNTSWYIFNAHEEPTLRAVMRLYVLKMYTNNQLVRNFIPCINNTNITCVYDIISQQPFYNQGTGEFLYGPKAYNCVGNQNTDDKYEIPITLNTEEGDKNITITLNEPLRKLEDKVDYLDLKEKKLIRNIKQDTTTGELSILENPTEESIEMETIDFDTVNSLTVNTEIAPSAIE